MQIAPTSPESIKPLLRPDQAAEAHRDIQNAEAKLTSPHIEDKREARNQLIRLRKTTVEQLPKPPANAEEEAAMVKRSKELQEYITSDGMLSHAEMRACPPGAADRHSRWEKRNKARILEWKNLQLRLCPGEREAANLERHRPMQGSMNLDNSIVERKFMFNVDSVETVTVIFSDEELLALKELAPEDFERVGSMPNMEREIWKKTLRLFAAPASYEAKQPEQESKAGSGKKAA